MGFANQSAFRAKNSVRGIHTHIHIKDKPYPLLSSQLATHHNTLLTIQPLSHPAHSTKHHTTNHQHQSPPSARCDHRCNASPGPLSMAPQPGTLQHARTYVRIGFFKECRRGALTNSPCLAGRALVPLACIANCFQTPPLFS